MIEPGQLCRDRTRTKFKVAIVLGPSVKGGKLRVCRWNHPYGWTWAPPCWSAPCALFEHQLVPFPADFDLTTRNGLIVAEAE